MIYAFEGFELDLATMELRRQGVAASIEPQVFALIALLVGNSERMVSKDEIIEKIWDGRVVSESALSSRVKSARQALGDDGKTQRFIRTLHGQGFRFVAKVRTLRAGMPAVQAGGLGAMVQRLDQISQPSLAVLPFRYLSGDERYAPLASALPDELIADLSRLRWLLVTARTSSFRLGAENRDFGEISGLLGVRYCLSGTVEVAGNRLLVLVELMDAAQGIVVWADRFSGRVEDVHDIREQIRAQVLAALEIRIPLHEASRARLAAVENLDAWSAYHLGLQHLYRFNRADSGAALALFERAVAIDPTFARANAGISFVHFQGAFLRYADDIAGAIGAARRYAERGLELDPLDPFVNFTMGRTYWLEGDLDTSLGWLERSTSISPHYAQGIYARAWTEVLAGKCTEGKANVDLAMRLSPLDPLHYAMVSTRAFAHVAANEDAEAAVWAERGACSPGAHVLIALIAAATHTLVGDKVRAGYWADNVRRRNATLTREMFFQAFPMRLDSMRTRYDSALLKLGYR